MAWSDQGFDLRARIVVPNVGHRWSYVGVEVTASRSGVRLGSASLWGVESDSGDEYFTEQALELAEEAISEAHDNLIRLCRNH